MTCSGATSIKLIELRHSIIIFPDATVNSGASKKFPSVSVLQKFPSESMNDNCKALLSNSKSHVCYAYHLRAAFEPHPRDRRHK